MGCSSDNEDLLGLLLKPWLTSVKVAPPPARQQGSGSRQSPSFGRFGPSRGEAVPSAIRDSAPEAAPSQGEVFPRVSINSAGTVGWSRRKHMLRFHSFHKRLFC